MYLRQIAPRHCTGRRMKDLLGMRSYDVQDHLLSAFAHVASIAVGSLAWFRMLIRPLLSLA